MGYKYGYTDYPLPAGYGEEKKKRFVDRLTRRGWMMVGAGLAGILILSLVIAIPVAVSKNSSSESGASSNTVSIDATATPTPTTPPPPPPPPPPPKVYGQCKPNPCKNNGTCNGADDGTYTCGCPAGWRGPECMDACTDNIPFCQRVNCSTSGPATCAVCKPYFVLNGGTTCTPIPRESNCALADVNGVCYDTMENAVAATTTKDKSGLTPVIVLTASVSIAKPIIPPGDLIIQAAQGRRPIITFVAVYTDDHGGFVLTKPNQKLVLIGCDMTMQPGTDYAYQSAVRTTIKNPPTGVEVYIYNMKFGGFTHEVLGAALFFNDVKYIAIDDTTVFANNKVVDPGESGGAALAFNTINGYGYFGGLYENNMVMSNHSDGGAIYSLGPVSGFVEFKGTFRQNWAMGGGAIWLNSIAQRSMCVVSGLFENNVARRGGCVLFGHIEGTVNASGTFQNNLGMRSAVFRPNKIEATGNLILSGVFRNNTAKYFDLTAKLMAGQTLEEPLDQYQGPVLDSLWSAGRVTLTGAFSGNTAEDSGGVVAITECYGPMEFSGVFTNNQANSLGGVVTLTIMEDTSITFDGTFNENIAVKNEETNLFRIGSRLCPLKPGCTAANATADLYQSLVGTEAQYTGHIEFSNSIPAGFLCEPVGKKCISTKNATLSSLPPATGATSGAPIPTLVPAKPIISSAKPVIPSAKPVIPSAKPVIPSAKPVVLPSKPVAVPAKPAATQAKPVIPVAEPASPAKPTAAAAKPQPAKTPAKV